MIALALAGLRARGSRTLLSALGILAASIVVGTGVTVGYGLATFATSLFALLWGYPADRHHIFYLFVAFMILATLVNVFGVRVTSFLNAISVWWQLIGVGVIVVALAVIPGHHQSAGYVFTQTVNNSGFGGDGSDPST